MRYKDLVKLLNMRGFYLVRESKHHIYSNGVVCVAIPHTREVAIGTLRDVFKQLYPNDFGLANKEMRQALGKVS